MVVLHIDASGLRPQGADVLNGIAFDSSTQSLWITGKEWPMMYNVTFIEPSLPPEPEPEVETPSSEENSVYSDALLAILLATVVILMAMNLKDGGRDPPLEGASE